MVLRRPILSSIGLLSSRNGIRCFSVSKTQWAPSRQQKGQPPRQTPQKSMKVVAQQEQRISGDLGLLPDTFISPTGANRPSIFKISDFTLLNWTQVKRGFLDRLQTLMYYYMLPKPRPKLRTRQIGPTAVGLHRQMYDAFAGGDTFTIRKICAEGLRDTFLARIAVRGRETVQWELIKYNKRAKVMSHRAATLGIEGMAIRQAVVRINSKQKLTRFKPDGSIYEGSGKEKDVQEYVVIQKRVVNNKEEDWQVWGTTEETTVEKIREAALQELA